MTTDRASYFAGAFRQIQAEITSQLEECDGEAKFISDRWDRPDPHLAHGGGGETRVLSHGNVFEQAGVNFSEVHGTMPAEMNEKLTGSRSEEQFFATGVSLVIHPRSPMVPTTHANVRYLKVGEHAWFGGGTDLTPYYLFEEDARFFHRQIKEVCDRHDLQHYPKFKKWCDQYFFLPHRGETRGVGGIFFDYLGKDDPSQLDPIGAFVEAFGHALMSFYIPIVNRRKDEGWGDRERDFQLVRRGRYVEFNLLYDRGTLFGLKTGGRTESILMSLPPEVKWRYCYTPPEGGREEQLLEVLKSPREWL